MIILITGTSCTGKTFISQKLMEKYNIPYISIDHIKMGLIRSGNTILIYLFMMMKALCHTYGIL